MALYVWRLLLQPMCFSFPLLLLAGGICSCHAAGEIKCELYRREAFTANSQYNSRLRSGKVTTTSVEECVYKHLLVLINKSYLLHLIWRTNIYPSDLQKY